MSTRRPPAVRWYRAALRLLPPRARAEGGDEMVATFADLYGAADGRLARTWVVLRCLLALPRASFLLHLDLDHERRRSVPMPTRMTLLGRWRKDLAYAGRTLRRAPMYGLTAVLLLSLGVAAVTAIFTLFDHILLRPLPYPDSEELVFLEQGAHPGPLFHGLEDLRAADRWAGAWTDRFNLTGEGDPKVVRVAQVSEGFFGLFGARATMGRLLVPDDFLAADAVVLPFATWQSMFAGDPAIIGQRLRLDDELVTVVGVVEASFQAPEAMTGAEVDLWKPLRWFDEGFDEHGFHVLEIAGRLAPGSTLATTTAEVTALVARLGEVEPRAYLDEAGRPEPIPVAALQEITGRGVSTGLRLLLGAVSLLLLIACTNVAHLSLARGLSRESEMDIRRALGASSGALVRQLLAESLVIAAAGGVLGVALAALAVRTFVALNPSSLPRGETIGLDARIVLFAVGLSALTALLSGLWPATRSIGKRAAGSHQGQRAATSGRGIERLRGGLVAAEVALSLVLLAGAGLLVRSFGAVVEQETGIDPQAVWRMPLNTSAIADADAYRRTMEEVRAALGAVPGVDSVAYGLTLPFSMVGGSHCCWRTRFTIDQGDGREDHSLTAHPISEDYFRTLGIPLMLGRSWTRAGASATPHPVVLPMATAAALFGSPESALGTLMTRGDDRLEVVGIAADTRHFGLDQAIVQAVYLPIELAPFNPPFADVAVKLSGPPPSRLGEVLRDAVWSVAPAIPVPEVRSMEAQIARSTAARRFDSLLFGTFAVVALLLAAGGLYGTLVYTVDRRRREMGIRIALGARQRQIASTVIRDGMVVSLLGALLGLGGALASARLLESRIWGIAPQDPWSIAAATALLLLTAVFASWLPARRASRTDPVDALRAD